MAKRTRKIASDSESFKTTETSTSINTENCETESSDIFASDNDEYGNLKDFVVYQDNCLNNKCVSVESDEEYDTDEAIEQTITSEISDIENNEDEDVELISADLKKIKFNDFALIEKYDIPKKSVSECYKEFFQFANNHKVDKRNPKYQNIKLNCKDGINIIDGKTYLYVGRVDTGKIKNCDYGYSGNYLIIKEEFKTFTKLMNITFVNSCFNIDFKLFKFNYLERLPPVCPLLIDCDIEYYNDIEKTRIYKYIMNDLINETNKILTEYYDIEDPKYYIFEKARATKKEDFYKDGLHLFYSYPINFKDYVPIYALLREKIKNNKNFQEMLKKNKILKEDINEIIDNCTISRNQPYMMYGNTKMNTNGENEYSPVYKLTQYNDKEFDNYKNYAVEYFSIYKYIVNDIKPLQPIKEFPIIKETSETKSPKTKKAKMDNDLQTPTNQSKDTQIIINGASKEEINARYNIEDYNKIINVIDKHKEEKKELIIKEFQDESNWLFNCFPIYATFIYNHPETATQGWNLINRISMFDPNYLNYDPENNKKIIISSFKEKADTATANHLFDTAKKFNKKEVEQIIKDAYKRNAKIKELEKANKYNDINIINTENYKLDFNKDENFNSYKFDKLFENNIINAINYFYKYYIYVGNDTFYKLYSKEEYGRQIYDFKEIKSNRYLDLNLKKELTPEEKELIENCYNFGYHRLRNAIKQEQKNKYYISFYNAIDTTKAYFTATLINDITKDLYFGQKGLNQFNIQVSNNLFFNENNLKRCLYFDDILNTNININEDNEYLKVFKHYIDNYIIKRTADDNDFNLIEQKRFYIYNYLKTIFNFKKNHTCLILLGGQGTLKSTLGKMIISTISNKIGRSLTGSEFLNESYSGSILEDALFVQLEELKVSENASQHNDMINNLKNIITADEVRIRKILKNPEFKRTFISYLITSNFNCPLKINYDDRRYVVMEINNKCEDEKFITLLNNLFENKDALISLYNYFKNTNFSCKCRDPNCLYHKLNEKDTKPFEYIEGILTPEKRRIIQGTSNIFEQFLVDFYYQIKYDVANEQKLNNPKYIIYNKENIDNSTFNITISQFYGDFKLFLESKKILKFPKKKAFISSIITGLFEEIKNRHTLVMSISLKDYRNLLFKNNLIDEVDDYIFIDENGNFINEDHFVPFSIPFNTSHFIELTEA